ncbi:hypothetical protein [Streptomyces qinzhouensis]|uniref:Uncharacterized protein n=1 Tax=Streptomyces qinzhouensis TaxID=2599401 RepID=A0A5B8J6T1_9ACTN|nr:hypothetical protein [Streptomyces qinzhouensis]QDY76926.1 hypothetical protein FQU76_10790 [Streptomyces qinzhouensis]
MRNPIAAMLTRLRDFLSPHRRPVVIVLVASAPAANPWTRPWTSPSQAEAQEILRQRATATATGTAAPPGARRLIVARNGLRFPRPVAVRAARPGPAWTWIR